MAHRSQNVTDYPNNNTIFSVWKFKEGSDFKPVFERLCALVSNLNHSFVVRLPDGRTSCIMGIAHDAWVKLGMPTPLPKELKTFEPIVGGKYTAISTEGDIHFHLRAINAGVCYELAKDIYDIINPVADNLVEVHGFRYWDGRSILGFVDGTENPIGDERAQFAMVGDEDPKYKGGSYLFVQKYSHNLKAWESIPTSEQEKVFGRYKQSDIEMTDEVKPKNSHSALTSITDADGNDLKIVRDNLPFSNPSKGEFGTYFISYANKFSTTHKMLENMYLGNPIGNYDRILDFSTPETGTLFFVPTQEMLDNYSAT
ncbi:Dyp-type peroxidase [Sphingobacterium daejeonense]|uniref:Dyp-type peroxidase n=1 Tax=Sphingobacterium daejeonense TaxID=371142 RepID=A0ABW3RMQ9_9SPHI